MSKLEILTPESPRWDEFADALHLALEPISKAEHERNPGKLPWRACDGGSGDAGDKVHRHAKRIMAAMGDIDVEGSLRFFKSRGGHCDCEILLNVDA